MRSEDPEYRYVSPMRQAFENAKVTPENEKLARRIVRVLTRRAAPKRRRKS